MYLNERKNVSTGPMALAASHDLCTSLKQDFKILTQSKCVVSSEKDAGRQNSGCTYILGISFTKILFRNHHYCFRRLQLNKTFFVGLKVFKFDTFLCVL